MLTFEQREQEPAGGVGSSSRGTGRVRSAGGVRNSCGTSLRNSPHRLPQEFRIQFRTRVSPARTRILPLQLRNCGRNPPTSLLVRQKMRERRVARREVQGQVPQFRTTRPAGILPSPTPGRHSPRFSRRQSSASRSASARLSSSACLWRLSSSSCSLSTTARLR